MFRRMQMNVIEWKWHGMRSSTRNAYAFNARTSHHVFHLQMKCTCDGIWKGGTESRMKCWSGVSSKVRVILLIISFISHLSLVGIIIHPGHTWCLNVNEPRNMLQFSISFLSKLKSKSQFKCASIWYQFCVELLSKIVQPLSSPMNTCWIYFLLILCVWCEWEQCPVRELRNDFKKARTINSWPNTQTKQQRRIDDAWKNSILQPLSHKWPNGSIPFIFSIKIILGKVHNHTIFIIIYCQRHIVYAFTRVSKL